MPLRRTILVAGVSGVGKSAVCAGACLGSGMTWIDFSDLLRIELRSPPDTWAGLADGELLQAGERAAAALVRISPSFVTVHAFAKRASRRLVLGAAWDLALPCLHVVFLEANPITIAGRRGVLAASNADEINLDQEYAQAYVLNACAARHTPVSTIRNETAADLGTNIEFLKHLAGQVKGGGT